MAPIKLFVILLLPSVIAGMALLWLWLRARQQQQSLQVELTESESRRAQMLSVADLAMVMLDEACHIKEWTPAMERLFNCRRELALGQQFFLRFAPPGEGSALTARAIAMRTSEDFFSFTFSVPVDNGSPRIVHWRAHYCSNPSDQCRYLTLVGNDVTALENALSELGNSEARLRIVFDSVPVALAMIDAEGRLRMVNPACAQFFGYDTPEHMVAQNITELIYPDDKAATVLALAALRAKEATLYDAEVRYLRQTGDARWGYVRAVLVELSPGQSFFLAQITDIHERKKVEHELQESEQHLATLMANLSGAVYRYKRPSECNGLHHDNKPDFLSNGVEGMTGHSLDKFMAVDAKYTLGSFIAENDRNQLLESIKKARLGDGRFKVNYRLQLDDKTSRWVSEQGLAWQRPDGSWSIDGHITDITVERQALEAAQVYRGLVADTHTGYLSLAESGHIIEVNQPYCDMFGLSKPEDVQGKLLEEIFPSHLLLIRGFIQVVLREGGVHDAELTYKLSNGQLVHALTSAIAIEDGGQRVIKSLLVDVTSKRRAEKERQEAEQRYRTLFETSMTGICFVSLESRIEEANPSLYRLLGFNEKEGSLVGVHMQDISSSEWQESDTNAREQILLRGWSDPYRKEFKRKDGSFVPVSIQSWLVRDGSGQPQRVMSMATDISNLCHLVNEKDLMKRDFEKLMQDEK